MWEDSPKTLILQRAAVLYLKPLALPVRTGMCTKRLRHQQSLKRPVLPPSPKLSIPIFSTHVCSDVPWEGAVLGIHINHRLCGVIQICSVAINHPTATTGQGRCSHQSMSSLNSLACYVSPLKINTGYHIVCYLKRAEMY